MKILNKMMFNKVTNFSTLSPREEDNPIVYIMENSLGPFELFPTLYLRPPPFYFRCLSIFSIVLLDSAGLWSPVFM